jgi:hypothetical protein
MRSLARQQGLSLIGFLFWGALVAFFLLIAIRMAPAYAEYFEVKKTMEKSIAEYNGNNAYEVRRNYDLKASAGYAEDIKGKDIEFSRENGQLVMSVAWTRKLPLFGNVSLLLDFDVTVHK